VKNFKTFKVGIFGLSSPDTPTSTSPANVASLTFIGGEAMAAQAREIVRVLKNEEKVDVVIALTHLGTEPYVQYSAQWLAAQAPGINYIIDGHSHSEVPGLMVGNTLIASTGSFFHNVGTILTELPANPMSRAILLPAASLGKVAPDRKITALLEKMEKELAREMTVVVGQAPFELEGRREIVRNESSNLGRLITAAMVKYTGADAALFNGGSIRASIPAGEITRGRLLEVLPFGNYAVTVKLRGSDLRKVIEQGLAHGGSGGFLQFSGFTVKADRRAGAEGWGYKIRSIEIGGKPLSNRAEYTVAINDFMNIGGDGYELLNKLPVGEYETVEEMLLKYISETPADELSRVSQAENLIAAP
jgi:5'-nucleotidase